MGRLNLNCVTNCTPCFIDCCCWCCSRYHPTVQSLHSKMTTNDPAPAMCRPTAWGPAIADAVVQLHTSTFALQKDRLVEPQPLPLVRESDRNSSTLMTLHLPRPLL